MSGNVGMKVEPILHENKMTYFKEHPTIRGLIITMPNLPNGLTQRDLYVNKKGYKTRIMDIDPFAKIVDTTDGTFIVREGEELKEFKDKRVEVDKSVVEYTYHRIVDKATQKVKTIS